MHFYLDCLLAGRDCLREISADDLRVVNTKLLPINSYSAVDLPADYCDYVNVAIKFGQYMQPLVPDESINSLNNFDSSMNIIRYDEDSNGGTPLYYGAFYGAYFNTTHSNNFGEFIGRNFGVGTVNWNTFKVVPERNQIQLNEAITSDEFELVLVYISDGRDADAATHVQPYAESTIEAYILWQLKEHRRDISENEKERAKRAYLRERQVLRARKNPLTIELLRKIIHKHQQQSIKS